jgi:ParB family chromosome partitioning protein
MSAVLRTVPVASLTVRPQSRRAIDAESVRELADSIAAVGLQHPILCEEHDGDLVVLDGHRRLMALRDVLLLTEVPVLVKERALAAGLSLAQQLACNLQRADLNPIERAEGIRELMTQTSATSEATAKLLGLSPAAVCRSLSLLRLPEDLRRRVADGSLPADSAYMLARVEDGRRQAVLAAEVLGEKLSRAALARKLKQVERRSSGRPPARVTAALGGGRSITLAGGGLTLDSIVEWLDQLLGRARKAKQQGLTLETFVRTLRDQAQKA